MRILEVSRYKDNFADHQLPFVTEQGGAIAKCLRESPVYGVKCKVVGEPSEVEYFLVKGNYITAVKALKAKIREFKPDIIHAHYGLSAITAELQNMVPVVTTFHNGETLNPIVNFACSLMSLRAKHVIYVAQHIREKVYFKAKHYSIIPCGVPMEQMTIIPKDEARKQLGWSEDKKYILFGGAFNNLRKNYPLLRSAIEILCNQKNTEKNKESQAHVAQSVIANQSANEQDSLQPNCQSLSTDTDKSYLLDSLQKTQKISSSEYNWMSIDGGEQYGDIVCVEMKGLSRAECVLRMNACDLFALPTKNEGSPQALKEAMACNCPIVATDVADIKHLLGDLPGHYILANKCGTPADWDGDEHAADELAELLKKAMAFEGRTKGRERITELGLTNELVAKRIIRIYEDIIR